MRSLTFVVTERVNLMRAAGNDVRGESDISRSSTLSARVRLVRVDSLKSVIP
jgi:hypothetical protein